MILEFVCFVSLIFLIKIYLSKKTKQPPNGLKHVPTVPGGWPIFGHYFKVTSKPFEYLNYLSAIHGPIFSIQIGMKNFIVMNNYDVMNKTLKEQGNVFSGRWQNIFTKELAYDSGILFREKEFWATQRSFALRVLKDFGFGRRIAENVVHREAEKLLKSIRSRKGDGINTSQLISVSTVNIICDFIMKKEYNETDEEVICLIGLIKTVSQAVDVNSLFMNIFPIFDMFPKITCAVLKHFDPSKILSLVDRTIQFMQEIVDEHKARFNPENESQDLIDAFLLEQYKLKHANQEYNSFTDYQLVRLIGELFLAGYETTSTTLSWTFLVCAKFPEIQKKLRNEIAEEIGLNRLPTMSDKKSLNYVQAFMDEIFRYTTVLPLAINHRVLENSSVNGYFIPANSIIFPNLYACHRDPQIWKKPNEFYPQHFLDESGKYKPKAELVPFGTGKRQCLGEGLARMEEFIVLICVLQNFEIFLDEKSEKMETYQLLQSSDGTFRGTIEHKLYFKELTLTDE